jgi:hypothetical protein
MEPELPFGEKVDRLLDGIVEAAGEFVRDDGPYEAKSHMKDMLAADRVREIWRDYFDEED